jgi:hypothetical protein
MKPKSIEHYEKSLDLWRVADPLLLPFKVIKVMKKSPHNSSQGAIEQKY